MVTINRSNRRSTGKVTPIRIWIPPKYTGIYKLEIIRSDGTIDDLTDLAVSWEFEDGVTNKIGKFKFTVWNVNEEYTNTWTGNEIVNFYSDYDNVALTKKFSGRSERILRRSNRVEVSGRSEALFFLEKTVTQSFTATDCSEILKSLNTTYGQGNFTVTNIATSGVLMTVNWNEKPFFECVSELSQKAGFDAYVDATYDWNFFEKGSRTNEEEGLMENYNLMEVGEFGDDLQTVKNKIRIYGAIIDGVQVFYTANDVASQNRYGTRVLIRSNNNIKTFAEAKVLGDFLLENNKDPAIVGDVSGVFLAKIQPGEKIHIGSPPNGLNAGTYAIRNYKHSWGNRGLFTTVSVEKKPIRITDAISNIIGRSSDQNQTSSNVFDLDYSLTEPFDDASTGTLSNLTITQGVLRVASGQTSGSWTSDVRTTDENVTEAALSLFGTLITGASVQISNDSGLNFQTVNNNEKIILATSGKSLVLKISITDTTTELSAVSVQYK